MPAARGLLLCAGLVLCAPAPSQVPIVSEFMARNGNTLADEDGEYSDWVEVHNPGAAATDLAGWYLTDDATDLTKWAFPAATVAAGGHLVVFASGKNRAVPGSELHTNFRLNGAGEFLALVMPDGVTLSTSFAPAFPAQRRDYSYGLDPIGPGAKLVDSGSVCSAVVPASGALGLTWTGLQGVTGWLVGKSGVGYETSTGYEALIGLDVQQQMYSVSGSAFVRIPFPVANPSAFSGLTLRMKYDDGFAAYLNGQRIAEANAPAALAWNSLATQTHPDAEAVLFEDFDVSAHIGMLQPGANMLAIHGLNATLTSSDFLILPELVASRGTYGANLAYFRPASPGVVGAAAGLPGFVGDVQFQVASGFYQSPFSVALTTATAGARIVYTTDGSVPSPAQGIEYTAPVSIQTTSVLRAAAFFSGFGPSNVDTRTYIFVDDVLDQPANPPGFPSGWGSAPAADYEMDPEIVNDPTYQSEVWAGLLEIPTLSLVMDVDDWFGSSGIYSNPTRSGRAWERAVSAELMYFDGTPGFSIDCGIRIQGGGSRSPTANPKHSMSLRFRDKYGAGRLDHPVFEGSPVTSFDSLHVRHQWGHSFTHRMGESCPCSSGACGPVCAWRGGREKSSLVREFWGKTVTRAMGSEDAGRGLQVNVYVNGLYWGVYNLHERQDNAHYASWHGGGEDDYDAISAGRFVAGNATSWNRLKSIAQSGTWAEARGALGVDNFIDYTIFNRYVGNTDVGPTNNWRAAGGGVNNAPWRVYHWDIDHILETLALLNPSPSEDPTGLLTGLMRHREFVVRFGDRVHRHLFNGGALTPAAAIREWNRLALEVDFAIAAESARWGDYRRDVHRFQYGPYPLYTKYDHVVPHRRWLTGHYFVHRTGIAINQFVQRGLYPSATAPAFNQHGGAVAPGFRVTMSAPAGELLYTTDGSDPRLPGGRAAPSAAPYTGPLALNRTTTVKARALVGASWSALNEATFVVEAIVLNELLARNQTGIVDPFGEHDDWIELYNKASIPISASGLHLTDDPSVPTKWQIPAGYTIAPGGTLLIWADEDPGQGPLHATFKLASSGEEVSLFDSDGATLLSRVAFGPQQADISTGWIRDGGGQLLVTYPDPSPDNPNEIQSCGTRRYSAQDSTTQPVSLRATGTPAPGQPVTFVMTGGQGSALHALYFGAAPTELALGASISSSKLMIAPPIGLLAAVGSTPGGIAQFSLTVPPIPTLAGLSLFFQAWSPAGTTVVGSSGLEIKFCP